MLNSKKLLEAIVKKLDYNLSDREIAIIKQSLRAIADIAHETAYTIPLDKLTSEEKDIMEVDLNAVIDWIVRECEKRNESKNEH